MENETLCISVVAVPGKYACWAAKVYEARRRADGTWTWRATSRTYRGWGGRGVARPIGRWTYRGAQRDAARWSERTGIEVCYGVKHGSPVRS